MPEIRKIFGVNGITVVLFKVRCLLSLPKFKVEIRIQLSDLSAKKF